MRRLRPLSEVECYARCYGGWERTVRIVPADHPPRRAFTRPVGRYPALEALVVAPPARDAEAAPEAA